MLHCILWRSINGNERPCVVTYFAGYELDCEVFGQDHDALSRLATLKGW